MDMSCGGLAELATEKDARVITRVLLGRDASQSARAELSKRSVTHILADILTSVEFRDNVVGSVAAGHELPHDDKGAEFMPSEAAWVRDRLPLSSQNRCSVAPSIEWRVLLHRIVTDAGVAEAVAGVHGDSARFEVFEHAKRTFEVAGAVRPRGPGKGTGKTEGGRTGRLAEASLWDDRRAGKSAAKTLRIERDHLRVGNRLQRLLHLGYSAPAERELLVYVYNITEPVEARMHAAYVLAGWLSLRESAESAQEVSALLELIAAQPGIGDWREHERTLLHAEALSRLGRRGEARRLLVHGDCTAKEARQRAYGLANLFDEPIRGDLAFAVLNRAFAAEGLAQVRRREEREPLSVGNVEAIGVSPRSVEGPRVTVILPAFRCEQSLRVALGSLSGQTWANLELILVDDASPDRTLEVARDYARIEPRLTVLAHEDNRGPYWARNNGLAIATGEFVMTHDTDDWSHPQKIERQVAHLLANPAVIGNYSAMIRVNPEFEFLRRGRMSYSGPCLSSFLMRREPMLERVGYWDSVRFAGDSEMLKRCRLAFGNDAVFEMEGAPLTLMHQGEDNITSDIYSQYNGFKFGARREYEHAAEAWYQTSNDHYVTKECAPRPFPIPKIMSPFYKRDGARNHRDVVIASDFRLEGGTNQSNLQELMIQRDAGLTTGLLQIGRYDVNASRDIIAKVRRQIDGGGVTMLTFGETVECDLLIVRHPPILNHLTLLPRIVARRTIVVINEPPTRERDGLVHEMYDPARCHEHLLAMTTSLSEPRWTPIGPVVRESFARAHPDFSLTGFDWYNIFDGEKWPQRPALEDRDHARKPVVGRHSRDQYTKWPEHVADIAGAYVSAQFDVRILGGADAAVEVLGYRPTQWTVLPFDSETPSDFLQTVDFFVYFTHSAWDEAFGRSILEAMLSGVPVIAERKLYPLFRYAALYCEPNEVEATIARLWSDPAAYRERVRIGRAFAMDNFGPDLHLHRLRGLIDRAAAPVDEPAQIESHRSTDDGLGPTRSAAR